MRCLNCGCAGLHLNTVTCPQCGIHLPSLMQGCLNPGTMLWHDTYRIDYPLGRGGFGITYRAFDISLERPIAIKEFYPQEHALREGATGKLIVPIAKSEAYQRGLSRFLREGTLLAKLDHPGVVRVYNSFQERGTAYLVMELLSGKTLRDEINSQPERRLSSEQTRPIMTKLINALHVVHQQEVYHLDLAPDNVMLTTDDRVVLIDFGASRQGLSGKTTQAFKEAYAPPEVIGGEQTSAASDVFELGMMLHEMITGVLPPTSIARLLYRAHQGNELWDAQQIATPWRDVVSAAIALNPQDRPASVGAWWNGRSPAPLPLPPPPLPPPPPPPPPLPPPPPDPFNGTNGSDRISSLPPEIGGITGQQGLLTPEVTNEPSIQPAGFALRLMAYLIDGTVLILSSLVFHPLLGLGSNSTGSQYIGEVLGVYIMLAFVYVPVMESSPKQGTIGKLLMGIVVSDQRGKRISLGRAYRRHCFKIFSYLIGMIGFCIAGFNQRKQALHDLMAKTLVIKKP